MTKATTTIEQALNPDPHHGAWFAATQDLFNRVAAFYFEVIAANAQVLTLSSKEALTALETLTHTTEKNPHPVMPLSELAEDLPAMFRRAAIHAALGSARSFYSHLAKWRKRKEKVLAKGKKFHERPPVPPRSWNKSVILYAGMYKDRTASSIMIKVWTGSCWSWLKLRLLGRDLPLDGEIGSPALIRRGEQWWLHTPVEKKIQSPGKIEKQITTNPETKICAVDLNLDGHIAVCTVQTAEGSIKATRFIRGGKAISGFRKRLLGRIARNRSQTGIIAEGEQDNAPLWHKLRQVDEQFAHLVSRRIVDFAKAQGATILVFEHLSKLRPEKGKYSKRSNQKRAFWLKARIFSFAKYKAWHAAIITARVNPRNTSRECARCGGLITRYAQGQPQAGYTPGTPLALCPECGMQGNADRNASLVIGHRLLARYHKQEKPLALPTGERESKDSGDAALQEPKVQVVGHSSLWIGHESSTGHGTAQNSPSRMGEPVRDFTNPLRCPPSRRHATPAQDRDYVGESEAAGL